MKTFTFAPLVSIVIPTYNRADKVGKALLSIKAQSYQNWEVVVVDDGSKDDIEEVIRRFSVYDCRIKFLPLDRNRGAQAARNAGIKAAKGEWVAFLDSDDEWLPDSLTLRLEVAMKQNVEVVHSDAFIQFEGKLPQLYNIPALSGKIYRKLLSKDGPLFPSLLVRKDALTRIGYLDEKIKSFQEWDTCIRLAKYFEFGFVPHPTFIYDYRTPNAISRDFIRGGIGYEQNISKHLMDIIFYAGFARLAAHYAIASRWYKDGNDLRNSRRCAAVAKLCEFLSVQCWYGKIIHLAGRVKRKIRSCI